MSEKKFTLLELHLDGDTQFGPATLPETVLGESSDASDVVEDHDEPLEADDDGSGGVIGVVVALVVLAAIGLAIRRFRRKSSDEAVVDEPEVVVN